MCVSLRGPDCGYVYSCAQAWIVCLSYLAHCSVCVCACLRVHVSMCVSLLYSSCLLTSIHSLMTELHSKSLQAATFRAPPKQTHISNNASWDWSQITQWNAELTHSCVQSNHQQRWIESLFAIDQVLHLWGRQEKCTHSTLTILDFSAIVAIKRHQLVFHICTIS